MLFKWIIFFGALASALGASVDEQFDYNGRAFASSVTDVSLYGSSSRRGHNGGKKQVTITETVCEDDVNEPTDTTDTTDDSTIQLIRQIWIAKNIV